MLGASSVVIHAGSTAVPAASQSLHTSRPDTAPIQTCWPARFHAASFPVWCLRWAARLRGRARAGDRRHDRHLEAEREAAQVLAVAHVALVARARDHHHHDIAVLRRARDAYQGQALPTDAPEGGKHSSRESQVSNYERWWGGSMQQPHLPLPAPFAVPRSGEEEDHIRHGHTPLQALRMPAGVQDCHGPS